MAAVKNISHNTVRVVCGPMFAGKTTELLKSVREALSSTDPVYRHVLVIKPEVDTRGACGENPPAVLTHDGDVIRGGHNIPPAACRKVSERVIVSSTASSESIIGVLGECVGNMGHGERMFVGIDEVQFFDPGWIMDVFEWLFEHGTHVDLLAVGLDMDRDGDEFPGMAAVMRHCAVSGVVPEKLVGMCSVCGLGNATHTFYKGFAANKLMSDASSTDQVLIGGSDLYEPRCYVHWLAGRIEREARL